jgi:ABC-type polar amino acid transport system ATPase subunit
MAVEPQMQRRWEEQLAGYVAASFKVLSLGNWASQSVQFVSKIVTALTLYFGAYLVIEGSLTVGELVAFNMLTGRVAQPVLRLAQVWQDFHQARLSIARLGDILNTAPEPAFTPGRATPPPIKGAIAFDHVVFRYRIDGPEVPHDVSLQVPPGQVVGIVGASGSGKSTLAKLVQRLYVPEAGRLLIDGVDLAMVDVAWLRRQVGMVLQENVLFNRTVRDDIALTDPAMAMERVVHAAKLAGAHDFILELPEGYDTMVGERGASLSGGQRQRIAIARALVGDPRILIFDEATSALDYESERVIQENMRSIVRGRTVLIIAHNGQLDVVTGGTRAGRNFNPARKIPLKNRRVSSTPGQGQSLAQEISQEIIPRTVCRIEQIVLPRRSRRRPAFVRESTTPLPILLRDHTSCLFYSFPTSRPQLAGHAGGTSGDPPSQSGGDLAWRTHAADRAWSSHRALPGRPRGRRGHAQSRRPALDRSASGWSG